MPSFQGIFKAIWYAWNLRNLGQVLFIFVFGLVFLLGAAIYGLRDRLPETPESMDLGAAHALIETSNPRYVRFEALPDFSRKIFRSGVWSPFWGNCPPDEIYEIDPAANSMEELRAILGCRVEVPGLVDIGEARTVWWPPSGTGEKVMAVSLAPLTGCGDRIWITSHVADGPHADIRDWGRSQIFSGVLATFDQALLSFPTDLSAQARRTLPPLPDAFAVVPDTPYAGEALAFFTTHYWVPIAGSDRLFLWIDGDPERVDAGVITGVLEPMALTDYKALDRCYAHFETVTGTPLPGRIGIIRHPTAEAYNRQLSGYSGMFMVFGCLWAGFGAIGIALYIRAPDWIYNAWRRALIYLSTGFDPGKKDAAAARAGSQDGDRNTAPPEAVEPPAHGIRSMYVPPGSLDPPQPQIPPHVQMARAFRALMNFEADSEARHLVFIQDFNHPNNPDAALVMIGCTGDMKEAEAALVNSGQRHPGLAMTVFSVHPRPWADAADRAAAALDRFDMQVGDYVVMAHAPVRRGFQRVVIRAVVNGADETAEAKAAAALKEEDRFALMGRVFLIGDSEGGPYQAMVKTPGSTLMTGEGHFRREEKCAYVQWWEDLK